MTRQKRVPPLIIEWEPDSDVIGDFSWRGVSFELVAKHEVAEEIKKWFTGFDIKEIRMVQDPNIKVSELGGTTERRIYLPYSGPELCELWVDNWLCLNESKSNLKLEKICGSCGYRFFTPKRKGLSIENGAIKEDGFFRVHQFSGWIFCTEAVKDFIEKKRYTNVAFLDVM
jgi:phage pi2 protein 07